MSKVKYRISEDSAGVYFSQWLLLVTLVITAMGTIAAVLHGAELVDSGWAIAVPAPLATGQPADAHQQMIFQNVLGGTQLLQKPSPGSTTNTSKQESHAFDPRVAVRPDGVEGWRPAVRSNEAGPAATTKEENPSAPAPVPTTTQAASLGNGAPALVPPAATSAQATGPSLAAPTSAAPQTVTRERECEAENDCGGSLAAAAAAAPKPTGSTTPAPALADAYGNVDEVVTPGNSAESPPSNANSATTEPAAIEAQNAPATTSEPGKEEKRETVTENSPATQEAAAESNDKRDSSENKSQEASTPGASSDSTSNGKAAATASQPVQQVPAEVAPPPPLTRQLLALRMRVRSVLKGYYRKQLNTADNDPWEVMHGMLAYGVNSRVRQGGPNGNPITSVGWMCFNKPCKGQAMLYVNPEGELRAKYGVGLQGHLGQLLAMLAQCRVSADYPMQVGKDKFTIRDLIEAEKKTCYPKSELTFKLLALQYYIDLNDKWMNDQGLEWDFPRLLSEEMAQPVRTAACGGTHRLSALSLTVKTRIRRGEPVDGEYAEAADFVKKYQQYAFRLQNKDGSLSTQWFKGPGDEDDDDRRIKTTGHILEWLCYSLSDEELRDQRTIRAVSYLANLMYSNYDHEWEIGPRSHATHALLLYDERVFQPFDKESSIAFYLPQANVAKTNQANGKKR